MRKIFALILYLSMDLGYSRLGAFVILRVFPFTRELTLRLSKLLFSCAQMARIINSDTGVSSKKMFKSYINGNDLSSGLKSLNWYFTREDYIPFVRFSLDGNSLAITNDRLREPYFNCTELREPEFVAIQSPTPLRVGETVIVRFRLELGIAGILIAFSHTTKEMIKRTLHSSQCVLQHLRMYGFQIGAQFLDLRQLVRLLSVIDRFMCVLINTVSLSQRSVVKLTADFERVTKLLLDSLRNFYSEFVSFTHDRIIPLLNVRHIGIACIYAGVMAIQRCDFSSPV